MGGDLASGVEPIAGADAGHSCGSASVLHRLPRSRPPPTVVGLSDSPLHEPTPFHALAWLAWALAAAASVQLAPNPLYVVLVIAVSVLAVETHAPASGLARAFPALLLLGVVFACLRVVLTGLTAHGSGTQWVRLPEATLPTILGGFTIGGPVIGEVVLRSVAEGVVIIGVMAAFGAFNAVVSHYELVQAAPRAFYEPGLMVTVGLAFVPSTLAAVTAVREADRARTGGRGGRRGRLLRVVVPVLESGMERAVALAESMDARGFGRAEPGPGERVAAWCAVGALGSLAAGFVALVGRARGVAAACGLAGTALVVAAVVAASRARRRPRYRRRPLRPLDIAVIVTAGLTPVLLAVVSAVIDRDLTWATGTVSLPSFEPLAGVALLPLLAPVLLARPGRQR